MMTPPGMNGGMADDEDPPEQPEETGERCPECDGTGRVDGRECPACDGTGNVMRGLGGG
jgi:DnaJ-class molecular chaperone